jgi:FkbM family methyltransferase
MEVTLPGEGSVRAEFGAHAPRGLVAALLAQTRRQPDTWIGRRISFLLRRIAIRRLGGRPLDVETLGAPMRLYPYDNVCERRILFTPQYFDQEELAVLKERMRPGFVFVDVGANVGAYALAVAAMAGPGARILAIEPQPDIFERLTFNARQAACPTVKAIACAIGDADGMVTLFVSTNNRGESSVKTVRGLGEGSSLRVPARTLHGLLRDEGITAIDAAKLDTEGAEDLILESFLRDAPESLLPSLLIIDRGEARWHADVQRLLIDHGYALVLETRTNRIYQR